MDVVVGLGMLMYSPSICHWVFESMCLEVHVGKVWLPHGFTTPGVTSAAFQVCNTFLTQVSSSHLPLIPHPFEFIPTTLKAGLAPLITQAQASLGTFSCCTNALAETRGVMPRHSKPLAQILTGLSSARFSHTLHICPKLLLASLFLW